MRITTTKNIQREKEKDIALMNAASLSRYEHIRSAAQTDPPGYAEKIISVWNRGRDYQKTLRYAHI